MEIKRICELIDERREELFELLSAMVRINSENFSTHGNEKEMAEYLYKLCCELGLDADLYRPIDLPDFENHPDYVEGRGLENRYNVTARWQGKENIDELMLMGHLDTVPVGDRANWSFEPLSGEIRDGKIWGRGACDDKYALATALFIIKILKDEGFCPKRNLLFSAYGDEEFGGSHGALASALKYPANIVVNMDGEQNEIWNCASGGQEAKYFFHTKDTANSAGYAAAGIPVVLEVMEEFKARRQKELSENRFYRGTIIPETSLRYMGVRAGNAGMDLGVGEIYFTYYTDKTCEYIYGEEFPRFEKILAERLLPLGLIGDGFKPNTRFFHYVTCEPDTEAIVDFCDATEEAVGHRPVVCGSCLSDLSVIGKFGGKCAFACGGGRDFSVIGGAHQPNEFIECDELVDFAKMIAAYVVKVL